ncbi:MAG TPA: heparan-alpha-glucosaminide N-acetyltransferase domain-containing protein [Gemmatimonadaceae bacterium]|jgi:predicted acyltransferase
MTSAPSARWRALDAFRGLAVIGMLLVNNPGDRDAVYSQIEHSVWNGCTIADLVFPFFLFVVGITTALTLDRPLTTSDAAQRRRIWKRAAIIFGIGLFLNWFPFYQSGGISWTDHPGFLDRIAARLLVLRIPGVLQRIGVVYLITALIARRASSRTVAMITAVLLLGYWMLLTIVAVPGEAAIGAAVMNEPARTIVAYADRALFDWSRWGLGNHLWDSALTWDPEGVLSTLPSIATALLGVLLGRVIMRSAATKDASTRQGVLRSPRALWMTIGWIIVGWIWSYWFPLNKSLWTSSFVLFTAGVGGLLLIALTYALDGSPDASWARPLIVFGENPLIAYAGSELARRILHSSIKIKTVAGRLGTDEWTFRQLETLGLSPKAASLAWTLLFIAAWWWLLATLSRRRLFLRA